jgi:phosphoribosylamine--glycine ligase
MKQRVLIVMGSDSDLHVMKEAAKILKEFGIAHDLVIASAHRTPERTAKLADNAEKNGVEVIIAGAGMAAHLAGVLAAHTTVPVIGVPIDSPPLQGIDALISTVQMPPGVPVATMSIGKSGAKNAAILSAQIIGLRDPAISKKLKAFKKKMAEKVERKSKALEKHRSL